MIIGIPKEIKENEYRVGCVPSGVKALADAGHLVLVESGAGLGSSITDDDYAASGAEIVQSATEVYGRAALIVKVKEPRPEEYNLIRPGQMIFTFLHLAVGPSLADALINKGVTAIAYETVELENGTLPLLHPMSEVAGRLAVLAGAHALMKHYGGRGTLLSGVPGVAPGNVVILGAGVAGVNAARIAVGVGADVTVMDTKQERLRTIDDTFQGRLKTVASNAYNLENALKRCDLLIGAVHIPGARTPRLVTRQMLGFMKKGAVIVDVSVDQGGCVETIRGTTHSNPTYEVDGIVHYGVANMPGAVPRTATFALTNATLPYVLALADKALKAACVAMPGLAKGINLYNGCVTHRSVAQAIGRDFTPLPFL